MTQHHVQEYDGGVVGSQRPLEVVEPQGRVDHRVGPSRGECVLAEVHHRVGLCGQVGTQSQIGRQGDVAPDRTQLLGRDQHRLVTQRPADEQTAQPPGAALPWGARCRDRPGGPLVPERGEHGFGRGGEVGSSGAEQGELDGGAQSGGVLPEVGGDFGIRRLGHDDDQLDLRVGIEAAHRFPGGDSAHFGGQVAAANTERGGDPDTDMVEQGEELLAAGARRSDDADRPGRHRVGEAETETADDRSAAVRPHHEQVPLLSGLLEHELLVERHVVAEDHHVVACVERVHRLDERAGARDRDEDQPIGSATQRTGRGPGRCHLARSVVTLVCVEQRTVDARERLVQGRRVGQAQRNHEVVGGCLARDLEAHLGEDLDVQSGRHRHLCGEHAVEVLHGAADLEQGHRVGVRPGTQLDVHDPVAAHAGSPTDAHSSAAAQRAPSSSPDPVECPTASRSRSASACAGRPERVDVRRELRQHLAVQRAVEQRRGQQGRLLHPHVHGLVDDGSGSAEQLGASPAIRRARRPHGESGRRRRRPTG